MIHSDHDSKEAADLGQARILIATVPRRLTDPSSPASARTRHCTASGTKHLAGRSSVQRQVRRRSACRHWGQAFKFHAC